MVESRRKFLKGVIGVTAAMAVSPLSVMGNKHKDIAQVKADNINISHDGGYYMPSGMSEALIKEFNKHTHASGVIGPTRLPE